MEKRVIQFISSLGDGGAQSLVRDYAIMLNKNNVPTEIVTVYHVDNSSNYNRTINAGINVTSILSGYKWYHKLFKRTFGFIYIPYKLLRIIKSDKITSIHVHMNQLHHVAPIAFLIKDVKIIHTCHNDPSVYFKGKSRKMEIWAIRKLVKRSNFLLIALHEEMAHELSSMFNTKRVTVIRNGVDFNKFINVKSTKDEKRKELGIDNKAFVVGHIGKFMPQKNHFFLIDIFAKIASKADSAMLLLIGSGELEQSVKQKLHNLGLDNKYMILSHRTDIPELLKIMDVFLFPSLYEGLPVSLIEAQVSKLHCVVSDTINQAAVLLPSTIVLSLKDTPEKWADECLTKYDNIEWNEELQKYDMNREIDNLAALL